MAHRARRATDIVGERRQRAVVEKLLKVLLDAALGVCGGCGGAERAQGRVRRRFVLAGRHGHAWQQQRVCRSASAAGEQDAGGETGARGGEMEFLGCFGGGEAWLPREAEQRPAQHHPTHTLHPHTPTTTAMLLPTVGAAV